MRSTPDHERQPVGPHAGVGHQPLRTASCSSPCCVISALLAHAHNTTHPVQGSSSSGGRLCALMSLDSSLLASTWPTPRRSRRPVIAITTSSAHQGLEDSTPLPLASSARRRRAHHLKALVGTPTPLELARVGGLPIPLLSSRLARSRQPFTCTRGRTRLHARADGDGKEVDLRAGARWRTGFVRPNIHLYPCAAITRPSPNRAFSVIAARVSCRICWTMHE